MGLGMTYFNRQSFISHLMALLVIFTVEERYNHNIFDVTLSYATFSRGVGKFVLRQHIDNEFLEAFSSDRRRPFLLPMLVSNMFCDKSGIQAIQAWNLSGVYEFRVLGACRT